LRTLEAPLNAVALLGADEALLTNSLLEVAPLVQLSGDPIGSGRPGEWAAALREEYLRGLERAQPPR